MNNDIFPCLWFNGNGKEAADFYVYLFDGKISVDTPVVLNIEVFGQKLMLLNAGSQFEKNPSVSFFVICETEEEVQKYWQPLTDGGLVMMELGTYPWSEKFGWVQDKYGVSWQIILKPNAGYQQKIIPSLMFVHEMKGKTKEAVDLYTSIFPNSETQNVLLYGALAVQIGESRDFVQKADFTVDGFQLFAMDSSYDHKFDFNEGISLVVMTDNQQETDHYWNSLTANGGRESMCGWLKDRFAFSWQIVPKKLIELMNDVDQPEKAQKVIQAMMQMQKIDIATIEAAYNS